MIHVGSRNCRKGLVFDVQRDMEETELEEGEASYFQDYDPNIDPDVSLSYIDEKIQNVLGHFQKDFEGGVSAENLGAKFGGYGSFLPTYKRSPIPNSPKVQNCNPHCSPNNLKIEAAPHNRHEVGLSSNSTKRDAPTHYARDFPSRSNHLNEKTLKVRIKVGPPQKNAEIYSGLGLDDSPSPSLNDSPIENGSRFSHLPQALNESPTSILQIMTSFPVQEDLLSPLSNDVLCLSKKEDFTIPQSLHKDTQGISSVFVSGHVKGVVKLLESKKTKLDENSSFPVKRENGIKKFDSLPCEQLVSNVSKLPITASSYGSSGVAVKNYGQVDLKNKYLFDLPREELQESNKKSVPNQKKISHAASDKMHDSIKSDSNVSKREKAFNNEFLDLPNQNTSQKVMSRKNDGAKFPVAKCPVSSSGRKKMSRASQNNSTSGSDLPKEIKNKGSHTDNYMTKSGLEASKMKKEFGKAKDRYREFFGDMKLGEDDDVMNPSNSDIPEKFTSVSKVEAFPKITINGTDDTDPTVNGFDSITPANGTNSDPAHAHAVQDWAQCDKCEKWRILPIGSNPDKLPDQWVCSMMNWLPGMNRCSVSEEVTTKAMIEYNQVPAPDSLLNDQHVDPLISMVTSTHIPQQDQNGQHNSVHDVPIKPSKSCIKNVHPIVRDGARKIKMKSRMENDLDFSRVSKKIKTGVQNCDGDWGLQQDLKDDLFFSNKKLKNEVKASMDDVSMETGKLSNRDDKKKRKVKDSHDMGFVKKLSEKKARLSKFDLKDPSANKTLPRQSFDGMDCLKKDSVHPYMATASSSSKISRSHNKTKSNLKESKGSPVESVSSSPLRISNINKPASARKNFVRKVDSRDSDIFANDGPKRDIQERNFSEKAKNCVAHSPALKNKVLPNSDGSTRYYNDEPQDQVHSCNEEVKNQNHCRVDGSQPRKSSSRSDSKVNLGDSSNDLHDHLKYSSQEKSGSKYDKADKNYVGKKANISSERSKREGHSRFEEQNGPEVRVDLIDCSGERSSKKSHNGDKNDKTEIFSGDEKENFTRLGKSISQGDDALVVAKRETKVDNQSKVQVTSSRKPISSGPHIDMNLSVPNPVKKGSSIQAASIAQKEAKDLKHMADRLKNSGQTVESTRLHFQAALKFLHSASLSESCNADGAKHAEMIQSMQMYSTTAKLCEYCAHEFEKLKDMAATALAYKCAEVAYMRVIYLSHNTATRDRRELQMIPPGESPSSSASDLDNLNNPWTVDKVALLKGVDSLQVAGNHVIAARNRPNFVRLLAFAQNVNFAMEASKKSHAAVAAANDSLGDGQYKDGTTCIKRALDFSFQDIEGLLRLVRLAMEAINKG